MKITALRVVIAFMVLVGVASLVVLVIYLAGGFESADGTTTTAADGTVKKITVTSTLGSTTTLARKRQARQVKEGGAERATKTVAADGTAPTAAQQATYRIDGTYRIVTFTKAEDWLDYTDMDSWSFHMDLPDNSNSSAAEGHQVIFKPRGADDLVAPIGSIASDFHSLYVTFDDHMYANGFKPGNDNLVTASSVTQYKTVSEGAYALIGTLGAPVSDDTTNTPDFSYDVSAETQMPFNVLPEATVIPATITGARKNGVLMMAADHVSYTVKLGTIEHKLAVVLNRYHPTIKLMGAKQIWHENQWKYYDASTNQLTATATATIRTFWNQQRQDFPNGHPDDNRSQVEKDADEALQIAQETLTTTLFQDKRYGIPVEIMNQDFDLNSLKNSNITMDIFSTGHMGFREAKKQGYTLETLAADPIAMLKLFELNNLQITANFSASTE